MQPNNRIAIVDSLKGFALLGVVLIQFVGHFDFKHLTEKHFLFSTDFDHRVIQSAYFMIKGKACDIFALFFGLSMYIQIHRKEEQGIDFRPKLLWRLTILLLMGFALSLVYKGDILQVYSILGLFLILISRLSSKTLIFLAIILSMQIPIIYNLVLSYTIQDFNYLQSIGENFFSEANNIYANGNINELIGFNLWKGRLSIWSIMFYNGMYLQMMALLISGFLLGRIKFFEEIEKHSAFLVKILIMGILLVALFELMIKSILISEFSNTQKELISLLIGSWSNLVFTMVLILAFTLLYLKYKKIKAFGLLTLYGQMSLSNYTFQAIAGVVIFYGFGLGLYKFMEATWSLILGFGIFLIQLYISKIWLKHFNYGPMEWLWRSLTFTGFKIRLRKNKDPGYAASTTFFN